MRKYKSGSRWALWRWTITDSDYIRRLHIIMTPWFAICLHFIRKPDVEPHLHDHPVTFFSLVLKGWYKEWREKRIYTDLIGYQWQMHQNHMIRRYNALRASDQDRHKIVEVAPGGCITLAFMTKVKRRWGFHTPVGWMYYKDYYAERIKVVIDGLPLIYPRKEFYALVESGGAKYSDEIGPADGRYFLISREDFYNRVRF